jgi:predicted small lipoprotein YifL
MRVVDIMLLVLLLQGCGHKGPLVLPKAQPGVQQPIIQQPAAQQPNQSQ